MANKKQIILGSLLIIGIFLLTAFSLTTFEAGEDGKSVEILKSTFAESIPLVAADCGSGGGPPCICVPEDPKYPNCE